MINRNQIIMRLGLFAPAMGTTDRKELLRASVGVGLSIMLCDLILWAIRHYSALLPGGMGDPLSEIIVVSPFAASAFLIMTVPNSPLAQPWSVIIGNTLGTASGVLCITFLPFPVMAAALAVALSVITMAIARALHPPAAAMALNAVLLTQSGADTGPAFFIATVMAGSIVLVAFGAVFNPLTARRYPFRQPNEALPKEAGYLATILERFRLSANIGVADLSRLIIAAETEAAAHHLGQKTAEVMMTANPFCMTPDADLHSIRDAFREKPFQAIPVADHDGTYRGVIFQNAVMEVAADATAATVMDVVPALTVQADLPAILPALTQGHRRVIPVVDNGKLVGIITRSDLIRLLSQTLRHR